MQTAYACQHLRQLLQARSYVALGARQVTVQRLTGLQTYELQRWFYRNPVDARRGRAPCATEWYRHANLIERIDASLVTILFYRLYRCGFAAEDALHSAYLGYQELGLRSPRIDFDRAFDLAAHTAGIWLTGTPHFTVIDCPTCCAQTLTDFGCIAPLGCPFCKLLVRYPLDPRVQAHFDPPSGRGETSKQLGIAALCPELRQPSHCTTPRNSRR